MQLKVLLIERPFEVIFELELELNRYCNARLELNRQSRRELNRKVPFRFYLIVNCSSVLRHRDFITEYKRQIDRFYRNMR